MTQKRLDAASANGNSGEFSRMVDFPMRGLMAWSKTGTGTCTINCHDGATGAVIATSDIAAGTQTGSAEVFMPSGMYHSLSAVSGTVAVTSYQHGSHSQ